MKIIELKLINAFICGICLNQLIHNIKDGELGFMLFNIGFCLITASFVLADYFIGR